MLKESTCLSLPNTSPSDIPLRHKILYLLCPTYVCMYVHMGYNYVYVLPVHNANRYVIQPKYVFCSSQSWVWLSSIFSDQILVSMCNYLTCHMWICNYYSLTFKFMCTVYVQPLFRIVYNVSTARKGTGLPISLCRGLE